jgi:two-component system nitrate/nitrite response regulator NarL
MNVEVPSLSPKTRENVSKDYTIDRIDELIRHLEDLIGQFIPRHEQAHDLPKEEIILDRVVGGGHYLLVRMPITANGRAPLSPRENEIVRMVARGHPNKAIAEVLNISCWTVSAHLRRIFGKLGVTSRAAMIACLAEKGFSLENCGVARFPSTKDFDSLSSSAKSFSKLCPENNTSISEGATPRRKAG